MIINYIAVVACLVAIIGFIGTPSALGAIVACLAAIIGASFVRGWAWDMYLLYILLWIVLILNLLGIC